MAVLVGTAPKRKLGSWGDFEGLAERHSRLSADAQHRKLILAETLPTDFGAQGVERGIVLGSNQSGPDRGDDRSKSHSDSGALHGCRSFAAGAAIDICQDRDCNPSRTLVNPTSIPCQLCGTSGLGFCAQPARKPFVESRPLPGPSWGERDDISPESLRYGGQVSMTTRRSSGSDSHTLSLRDY